MRNKEVDPMVQALLSETVEKLGTELQWGWDERWNTAMDLRQYSIRRRGYPSVGPKYGRTSRGSEAFCNDRFGRSLGLCSQLAVGWSQSLIDSHWHLWCRPQHGCAHHICAGFLETEILNHPHLKLTVDLVLIRESNYS